MILTFAISSLVISTKLQPFATPRFFVCMLKFKHSVNAILVKRLAHMMEGRVGHDPQGGRITGWLQHKINCGAAVCWTEDFGDLPPLDDLTETCFNVTI